MLERHLQALEAKLPELCRHLLDATERRLREGMHRNADDLARAALNSWRSEQLALEPAPAGELSRRAQASGHAGAE